MTPSQQKSGPGSGITDMMIFRRRWWQHLLFWVFIALILFNIFRTSDSIEHIDLIYTGLFLVPLASVVYLNLYLSIPLLLGREKYLWYALSMLLLGTGGAAWLYMLFDRWVDLILPHYYFISYYSVFQLLIFTASMLLLTTLIKLSRSWFMMLRLERIQAGHQLKSLQRQINPHFLLNSLQTIYALALEQSRNTPKAILQLSEILKYTLYESDHRKVELVKEITLIRDYVEMYRFRVDPKRVAISLEVTGEPGRLAVAPMLLIPFVENCFKHGIPAGPGPWEIKISLRIEEEWLDFVTENPSAKPGQRDRENQKGIGIDNTKQRLQLLYPGRHQLRISETGNRFRVSLKVKLESWEPATVSS